MSGALNYSGGGGMFGGFGCDVLVANNTAVSGGTFWSVGSTNCSAFNNIHISGKGASLGISADTSGAGSWSPENPFTYTLLGTIHIDHNIYNGLSGYGEFQIVIYSLGGGTWLNSLPDSFSQWQSWWGYDLHSTTATVQLDADFAPLTNDVVAIGNGTNLTAWGITDDYAGNPRPATGNWTIGAYETASMRTFVSLTASPTSIINGQSTTLSWSTVNATIVTLNGGSVPLNGSNIILPNKTTTYTVMAAGPKGTYSASVTVTNLPSPPSLLRPK